MERKLVMELPNFTDIRREFFPHPVEYVDIRKK
ncbi:hypothetical protein EV586_101230 [Tumebacillus sp. BK434]|nr:hypothetical protein EV586_101230 [Tumebacillus sp. BK434]